MFGLNAKISKWLLLLWSGLWILSGRVIGQSRLGDYLGRSHDKRDTTYIRSFDQNITGRIYFTRKNTGFTIPDAKDASFDYKPNNASGLGLGFSYRYLTLNASFNVFGKDAHKGKTKSLSLQTSLYKEQWVYDLVYQRYKGQYLSGSDDFSQGDHYYLRPDIRSTLLGGDFWRVMNSDRFSYRSVMTQNEQQLKSAGSLLLGGELYLGGLRGDSALLPSLLMAAYPQQQTDKIRFFRIGVGAGYAYSYVFQKHFFVSAGLTAIVDYAATSEFQQKQKKSVHVVAPNLSYRVSVGYNSRLFNINASVFNNSVPAHSALTNRKYNLFDQQFRVTIAKRFNIGHKLKTKLLKPVDEKMDQVEEKVKKLQGN